MMVVVVVKMKKDQGAVFPLFSKLIYGIKEKSILSRAIESTKSDAIARGS